MKTSANELTCKQAVSVTTIATFIFIHVWIFNIKAKWQPSSDCLDGVKRLRLAINFFAVCMHADLNEAFLLQVNFYDCLFKNNEDCEMRRKKEKEGNVCQVKDKNGNNNARNQIKNT